jgi:hypothetical protein
MVLKSLPESILTRLPGAWESQPEAQEVERPKLDNDTSKRNHHAQIKSASFPRTP